MAQELGGGRYLVTWAQLGSPTVRGDYEASGLGEVVLDDADVYYASTHPDIAAFFVRESAALGPGHYVVIGRVRPA